MKFPWANIALLVLGGIELLTGYLALTNGTPEWVAALHVHRILGFGIVALLGWKFRNIVARLRPGRHWKRNWLPYGLSLLCLPCSWRPWAWAWPGATWGPFTTRVLAA